MRTGAFRPQGDSLVVFQRVIVFNHFLFVPQLLRLVTLSEKRWRARAREADGRSDDVEGFHSGDCDDEDECTGVSGLGPPPRRKRLRVFSGGSHARRRLTGVPLTLKTSPYFDFQRCLNRTKYN